MNNRHAPLRYWIAACLGSHAVVACKTRSIAAIHPSELRSKSHGRNAACFGHVAVSLLLLYQLLGSMLILFRAFFIFREVRNWYYAQDSRNLEMILGAGLATCINLGLVLLNTEWHHLPSEPQTRAFSQMEIQGLSTTESHDRHEEQDLSNTKQLLSSIHRLNRTFALWLTNRVPLSY
ncbi:hypothetical protein BCR34DRAFT_158981 [Clohesyomyces aquaticus]|uniref:Uncharacterized protein n=1 Tax=Clohesyomyces aquaticus TaxID=1231657 RepID=A0A1Y1YIS4_9PLEO|nr:hypothetical protein BCR34DRAFT_158981 [Clohesyomyces aquaticus]